MKKKLLIGLIAGSAVFAAVFGAAASLGTITDNTLGASTGTVGACDNGVTTGYTVAWDTTDKRYELATVTVSGIDNACDGKKLNVAAISGSSAVPIAEVTIATDTASTSETVTLATDASRPTAASVDGIHVSING